MLIINFAIAISLTLFSAHALLEQTGYKNGKDVSYLTLLIIIGIGFSLRVYQFVLYSHFIKFDNIK